VAIGPAAAAESYLVVDKLVEACKATGAQAVHPGFGFLAENAGFVEALEAAGIVFIGPPTKAIAAMGDKIESKKLAAAAKVSTVPGHMDRDIGYPVMIKASAGGGGKGMRVARDDGEAREGFRAARSEAKSSFADDRIFIEKFIEEPRHIEIQVLADGHGNVLHLGERECSIQRRHQKVMGAQAVALAKAVDYRSAGTVEFIVDKDRSFYFLEMNTRIQVEHPVTELITGLDIVEWMIRVAAGEALGFGQDEVKLDGWAVEARVYAEDPVRNFMPSIGRLVRYQEPAAPADGGRVVRVDSGVVEGSEISMYYDPMIAKVVAHGPDRAAAIESLQAALDGFYIRGINHNMSFLAAVMAHERFRAGRLTTNFIAEEFPNGFHGLALSAENEALLVALAAVVQRIWAAREAMISGQMLERAGAPGDDWVVAGHELSRAVTVTGEGGAYRVTGEHGEMQLELAWAPGEPLLRAAVDGKAVTVQVDRHGSWWRLSHGGAQLDAQVLSARSAELAARMPKKEPPDLSRFLLSPMPGLLVSLAVEAGQEVKAGEELAVVEAMKMENLLRAERDGVVAKVHAGPGSSLAVDQPILEFE
jgi:propionyl-CoA carboxylase alpha chain